MRALARRRFNALKPLQEACNPATARVEQLQKEGFGARQAETNARAAQEVVQMAEERKNDHEKVVEQKSREWHDLKSIVQAKIEEIKDLMEGWDLPSLKEEMASVSAQADRRC